MNQVSYLTGKDSKAPKTARGKRTRDKLLAAAEAEFGERGFHEAAISGITERAGCALGTFYVHFDSKEAIFRALVAHMGRLTRHWLTESVKGASDRVTAERMGVEAFIVFVRRHRDLYRIVMEAQFVAEDAYRAYYSDFAEAYRANLSAASGAGEIRPGGEEARAWALIGMNVFLGLRYAVWDEAGDPAAIADAAGDLIAHGLIKKG